MRKRGLFVRLCLRPARERRHAWKARRTLCMFICRTAIYPTLFCKIQKPTSATPNKRWTDVAGTHLSRCLIHSSLPTNPSLPLLTQQDDICFHAWCMRLYLTVQPRVRLHVLRLLNLFLEPSSIIKRAMSTIPRGSIKQNESKSHPGGFYMHRNAWLMRRSGMARVFGTLLFSFC